ncbi:MAG: transcriptional regulator, CdaR [Frankiales bacterium]|nr:transcriptional regulator, CdaR [Frankiales bacterium]
MVADFVRDIPFYGRLPAEQLSGEITELCLASVRAALRAVREQRGPTPDELAENRDSAARRAHEQVPLEALLEAYIVGGRLVWRELVNQSTRRDGPLLLEAADAVQLYVQRVTSVVTQTYLSEQQLISGAERERSRELARALVAGTPLPAHAAAAQWQRGCQVLALAIDPATDELSEDVDQSVARARKLRRLEDVLRLRPQPVLALLEPDGGIVLIRADEDADDLVRALSSALGVLVRAGAAPAGSPGAVPAAAVLAQELVPLAVQGRVARLEDNALAYQLTRPTAARPRLAEVLQPLTGRPDLLATLRAYLRNDLDRQQTAAELHIHPNTLDHRLRRIAELSGRSTATVHGLVELHAALCVVDQG